jgi:NAD-dependent dihydropyrimidine dehydrogenase PreA subunit
MTEYPTIVVSQGQVLHPGKRGLEEEIIAAVLRETTAEVLVLPNLYDLLPGGPAVARLKQAARDLIVLAWHYPRSTHWVLHRYGVRGHAGRTLLSEPTDADEAQGDAEEPAGPERVSDQLDLPARTIYCFDLRVHNSAAPYVVEVKRLLRIGGNGMYVGGPVPAGARQATWIEESVGRRWYPVIDFSRCTNCLECLDFCLFGVYGVDRVDTILVEQPDNCRKGCPACSRVCPENAIIFPRHKTPVIAGAAADTAGLKIDLSQLFGAPENAAESPQVAVRERDEQLLVAGRAAVDERIRDQALPQPEPHPHAKSQPPRDDLDRVVDALDAADL